MITPLVAVLLHLRPSEPVRLKSYMGRAVQQFVLKFADRFKPKSDPGLPLWMHPKKNQPPSPYTACGLFHSFDMHPVAARGNITPLSSLTMRITSLHERVSAMLCATIGTDPFEMEFDGVIWQVERIVYDDGFLPARATYETLSSRYKVIHPRDFEMTFLTPVLLRTRAKGGSQQYVGLPIPSRIFVDLAERWNTFAPPEQRLRDYYLPGDPAGRQQFMRRVEQNIFLKQGNVNAQTILIHHQYKKGNPPVLKVGFTGDAHFQHVTQTDHTFARELATLADYTFFAGLGRETTAGMGLVRSSFL